MGPTKRLSEAFLQTHPEKAVRVFERYPAREVAALLDRVGASVLAPLLEQALPVLAGEYLVLLDPVRAATALQLLPTDMVLNLLRPLDQGPRESLLAAFPAERRRAFERLLVYPEGTAGSLMNPFAFVLPEELTVAEAMRRVREVGRDRFYFPYVVDREQKLVGLLTVRGLMLAGPDQRLAEVMHRDVVRLPAGATSAHLERVPGWRAYQSLPVVDEDDVLIGAVPYDRLARLESRSPPGVAATATEIFLTLGGAYWACLAQLTIQAAGLFANLTRPRATN